MRFFGNSLSTIASRIVITIATVTVIAGITSTSSAGVALPASTALTNDAVNKVHDSDNEVALRSNGMGGYNAVTGNLQAGDLLLAIVNFSNAQTQTGPINSFDGLTRDQMTAVSIIQVSGTPQDLGSTFSGSGGTNPDGSGPGGVEEYKFSFTSASTAAWSALTGKAVDAGTVLSVYDNNTATPFTNNSGVSSDIASAVGGSLMWNFGFTSTPAGDGTVAAQSSIGEGWQAIAPLQTSALAALSNPNVTSFNGALSLLSYGPSGPELNTAGKVGNNFNPSAPGQFDSTGKLVPALSGTGIRTDIQFSGNLAPGSTPDFGVSSGANFFINVAPEPSSLLLMGLGFVSFAGASYRRRKARLAA